LSLRGASTKQSVLHGHRPEQEQRTLWREDDRTGNRSLQALDLEIGKAQQSKRNLGQAQIRESFGRPLLGGQVPITKRADGVLPYIQRPVGQV